MSGSDGLAPTPYLASVSLFKAREITEEFSEYCSSNICACAGSHSWYLTTEHSTKTKTVFSLNLSYIKKNEKNVFVQD